MFGDKIFILDGGMGTSLQRLGLKGGEAPENWNLENPDAIFEVHKKYFEAGANAVYSNTFGANQVKFHGRENLDEIVFRGVELAKKAAELFGKDKKVALDVGPTGRLFDGTGKFGFNEAYDAFARQIKVGVRAGADFVAIETMGDIREAKAAILAAKENSSLPVLVTMTLSENGKTLTGSNIECIASVMEGLRVDAIGFNCGFGPNKMFEYIKRLSQLVNIPIVAKPNAGLPVVRDGETAFDLTVDEFAYYASRLVEAGASIVGGCCGTTSEHIAALKKSVADKTRAQVQVAKKCFVSSATRIVEIPLDDSIVIGERINPTGKKKLKEAYLNADTSYILREAVAQADAGADVLDVNAGVPGIDEAAELAKTVEAIQGVCDLPLQIDTSNPAALERALRIYNGKALVNSVNGKEESMASVFPIVAKYGGVVVALTLDENGIPPTAEGRLAIAKKILSRGKDYGLTPDDFVIDALCLAVSSDENSAKVILETLRRIKNELGCRTCLGVSNISFGLPARNVINASFYTMALMSGLSAGIINPLSIEMMNAYRAYRALVGKDKACADWIEKSSASTISVESAKTNEDKKIFDAVKNGLREDAARFSRMEIEKGVPPLELVNAQVVPALEYIGSGFEKGTIFLPQLLMAAEAARAAFQEVSKAMPAQEGAAKKGVVVMATVKGDIHDIGKNICCTLLENYGFEVIDLGRDVTPEDIVAAVDKYNAKLVGLSALMTTTLGSMEETIQLLHERAKWCKVAVGGAVLTAEYAASIGADIYTKDAMGLVRQAERLFSELN
jgi:5-methyltetrahydrofolate--homocysteine methyltransferase